MYAPNGKDPLYDVLVYVPNGAGAPDYGVQPFAPGVACGACGSEVTGAPLVSAVTGVDGSFTLRNMPVGTGIPLVMQRGRWRRKITIAKSGTTTLPEGYTFDTPVGNAPAQQCGRVFFLDSQVCGGGGVPNPCFTPACVPRTCAAQGYTCGSATDGCGNTLDCGTCTGSQTCGGCGMPNVCCDAG